MFEKLFSPIKIRDLELRNRVVMSAMGTHESAESEDGKSVTDKLIAYHVARAKGGCGLNTVEVCAVDKASSPHGFLSLAEDKYIEGNKKLNDAVHAAGGKTCLQLWQGGLAVASDQTAEILLPDAMPLSAEYTVPAITEERLLSVIEAYGEAARRAVEAGYDSIEFHCAHNYLPHSMLSGGLNHRTDNWGGSFENREKFPLECIKAIRKNMPEGMPLFMRIGCHDDMLEGGLTVEEVIRFCKDAKEAGVDVLNISRGNILTAATMYEVAPVDVPNGFNVSDAARIRKETGMLTMPCGRINTPEFAEKVLKNDDADLVVMARAQLADPNFCNKAKEGKLNAIKYCIGCDQGCYDYFCNALYNPAIKHITCMRNPALLEEENMELKKAEKSKKVLIAGGGIAGIEAAADLLECGHTPVIYEASASLGGQFAIAGVAPRKDDFKYACDKAIKNIEDLGVEVHLNTVLNAETIKEVKPDAVIIATGSSSIKPNIPGIDADYVVDAHDLLRGKEVSGKTAVVIGGGLVGIECSEFLAEKGFTVSTVEMQDKVLTQLGQLRQIGTQMALAAEPITIMTETVCKEIKYNTVIVSKGEEELSLAADLVVVAVGSRSNDSSALQEACKELNIEYHVVGDANKPGLALAAIHQAYNAVLEINK
ncbi:MAG: NAD(P)/FAD-dependent oxidoreductase [Erysipelotrichaceae bacterium]|nr:NAD(P)/FAD-dependent oxidoreductase [Erysipelotrichaceae bacterium]